MMKMTSFAYFSGDLIEDTNPTPKNVRCRDPVLTFISNYDGRGIDEEDDDDWLKYDAEELTAENCFCSQAAVHYPDEPRK